MYNVKCSCILVTLVPARFFIPCVIQSFFSLPILLYLVGILASKIFKKVNKNELNLLLVSLPLGTDSHVSLFRRS
jgi:hypothetical protein